MARNDRRGIRKRAPRLVGGYERHGTNEARMARVSGGPNTVKEEQSMPKEPTTPEEEGVRIAHLLLAILAGAQLLRIEVRDRVAIDRHRIVDTADNIEKPT